MDPRRLRAAQCGIAVMFFNLGFGYANWLARIPAVRERLALNDQELGLMLLMAGVGALVAFRMAPALLRRHGTRLVGTLGSSMVGLLVALPAVAPTGLWAGAGLWVLGWFNGIMDVALNAQAVQIERELKRPILAALHGCFSLGGFCGGAVGALAATYDLDPAVHLGALGVVLLALSLAAGRVLLRDEAAATAAAQATRGKRPPAALILLGTIAFCSSIGEGAMADWTAVYLRDVLHTSMGLAATGYAVFSLAMVVGRLVGDRVATKANPRTLLTGCGLIAATSLGLGLYASAPAGFAAATLGVGAGLSLVIPVVLRAAVTVPGIGQAQALSIMATLSYGGFLLGPPIIGFVSNHFGLTAGMAVVVGASALLSVLARAVRPAANAA